MSYRLEGYDTFEGEYYSLATPGFDDGLKPSYDTREEALEGARKRLADLEKTQPSASSGGQGGLQDHVYIVHPDNRKERVFR